MHVQPYLYFSGRTEEAVAFYKEALGAVVEMSMRFNESPEPAPEGMLPADWGHKIMHCAFKVGDSLILASDGCGEGVKSQGFSLALNTKRVDEAKQLFNALSEGGEITMPMGEMFFSPAFGMLTDRFGVAWTIVAEAADQGRAAA